MTKSAEGAGALAGRMRPVEHRVMRMLCTDLSGIEDPGKLRTIAEQGYEAVRRRQRTGWRGRVEQMLPTREGYR